MAAIYGNLPPTAKQQSDATVNYFNNIGASTPSISPNANGAVVAYFQDLTGDIETGNAMAATVIYTALQQHLDPVALVEQLKTLSDKNKATSPKYVSYIDPNQQDTDVTTDNGTTWTSGNVQYAKPGPSTAYNSISEVDAYLTMFLNFNRTGTSLLGLSNSPQTSPYISRTILA
jgi:hypothetical protein